MASYLSSLFNRAKGKLRNVLCLVLNESVDNDSSLDYQCNEKATKQELLRQKVVLIVIATKLQIRYILMGD